jgi:hypothetical protein
MAKLKAPLLSLGASQQLGKTLVFFPWKGLNVAREYVVPANPRTASQTTQRGYLSDAVEQVHESQASASYPLNEYDTKAYDVVGSNRATPRTWFNEVVKQWVDQKVAALFGAIFRGAIITEGDGQVDLEFSWQKDPDSANNITAGDFYYGTSKTALIHSQVAVIAAGVISATIAGLTNGTKYYFQFRATAHADFVGARSGIYHGTPHA